MSDLVDPNVIEQIVGTPRHPTAHYGRAVSAEQRVYVLHSAECVASTPDLRDCDYSVALDLGIAHPYPWRAWQDAQDRPVRLEIFKGWVLPDTTETTALAAGEGTDR